MRSVRVHRPSPAMAVACLALVLSMSGVTYAATGGTFVLGHANSAGKTTSLSSSTTGGPSLRVVNSGNKPAAAFGSKPGVAPFSVSGATKVAKLNADALDGLSASAFVRSGQRIPAATVMNTVTEVTTTASNKTLTANLELFDHGNLFAAANNASSFVVSKPGIYFASATVDWDPSGLGYRRTTISGPFGPVASVAGPALGSPAYTSQTVSGVVALAAGQSVQVEVLQGSGSNLSAQLARFEIAYIGR